MNGGELNPYNCSDYREPQMYPARGHKLGRGLFAIHQIANRPITGKRACETPKQMRRLVIAYLCLAIPVTHGIVAHALGGGSFLAGHLPG